MAQNKGLLIADLRKLDTTLRRKSRVLC